VADAIDHIVTALSARKPLLICGNGGSAADAMHIAGELVGRFRRERIGLKAIALGTDAAVSTALSNDYAFDSVFARQVEALGEPGGVVWGISTGGNSENVVRALTTGRKMGMSGIALTGTSGGRVSAAADIVIAVPSADTPRIQEIHTLVYHHICEQVEAEL
jgi:D-sedoheptulose 7-phosphate isomerase